MNTSQLNAKCPECKSHNTILTSKFVQRTGALFGPILILNFVLFFIAFFMPLLFLVLPFTGFVLIIGFFSLVHEQTKTKKRIHKHGKSIENYILRCNNCKLEEEVQVEITINKGLQTKRVLV